MNIASLDTLVRIVHQLHSFAFHPNLCICTDELGWFLKTKRMHLQLQIGRSGPFILKYTNETAKYLLTHMGVKLLTKT